jgi:5-methylcytosine-specific restriction endonuclease McrA
MGQSPSNPTKSGVFFDKKKLLDLLGLDIKSKVKMRKNKNALIITIGLNNGIDPEIKKQVLKRCYGSQEYKCLKCGKYPQPKSELHFHHVVYRSSGGDDSPDNLIPLCFNCHTGNNGVHNDES